MVKHKMVPLCSHELLIGGSNQSLRTMCITATLTFVPTFVTKVTKYMCSRWIFSSTNFDLLTSHFWLIFFDIIQKNIVALSLFLNDISPVIIIRKVMGI